VEKTFKNYNSVPYHLSATGAYPNMHMTIQFLEGEKKIAQQSTKMGYCNKKGEAVPLQAWSGPEGSRKLRFPDLMITAQDGGKVVSLKRRPRLPPGNTPGTHFC
jgi:hypothetical protein